MNYYSTLGPIDPQVPNKEGHLVAALGYLDKINELLDKAKRNELTQAEFLILKDFDLAELRSYEQAKELAIDMLKKWLTTYKFKDWTIHSDGSAVTQEEKEHLTARLRQAAEQEDNMKDSTKRAIRHTSHRLIIGVAVAAALTTGALAAAVGGGLMGYFEARTPEDQSTLEEGIYQLNRSETHNGWTVELTDCIGDDSNVYLWVDVTAPEGTALTPPEGGWISSSFQAELPEDVSAAMMTSLTALPDEDAGDNRISFCIMINAVSGDLRGKQVDITIEPITESWVTTGENGDLVFHEGGTLTEAIRDHKWVFEDVMLDYPDQTIRLEPHVEVPYLDGTATLTKVEISPLNTLVRIEGGSCYDHHNRLEDSPAVDSSGTEEVIEVDGFTITVDDGSGADAYWNDFICWDALETALVMKDGAIVEPSKNGGGSGCQDGVSNDVYQGPPYVERKFQYAESSNAPRVIDPSQVDYILVCGVRIDLPQ